MTAFVGAVVDSGDDPRAPKPLHLFADEYQALNIIYSDAGSARAWHYDGSDSVLTVLLQKAESGGTFECASNVRGTDTDEDFATVERVLDGDHPMITSTVDAGTLNFFNGAPRSSPTTPLS
jgi:hypothetical protein